MSKILKISFDVANWRARSYQEMITHIPMASHPNPEKVLVIGGGDGGVVREVLKHDTVKQVVLCDIDEVPIRPRTKFYTDLYPRQSFVSRSNTYHIWPSC